MGKNRRRARVLTALGICAAVVGGAVLYTSMGREEPGQKFRKVRVERGDISSVVTATGTINPVVTVLVGSQVSGTIRALHADFNSRVKEGEVIAQIDPSIFEAQVEQAQANLSNAQAGLLTAQANLKNAEANLVKAEVALADARRTLERNVELMAKGVIAQAALDTARTSYDSAVAQREGAKAQIETTKAQVESAKAQVEQARAALKLAQTNLRYTTIRSPVNGIVISRNVDVGQTVAASLQAPTLFTIAKDLTQMQVDTNVSEADIGAVREGMEATFTVDAYPDRTFRGRISEIRNAPVTVQNVVTYDVVVQVENKDLRLKPGMTANVTIVIAHRASALKVPNQALRFQPEGTGKEEAAMGKGEGRSSPAGALMERLAKSLDLTEQQRSQIQTILAASRGEFQAVREGARPEEAGKRVLNLLRQKLWGVLTEEQRTKLEQWSQSSGQGTRGTPARVWTVSPDGRPRPVPIVIGISDGTFTEVISGDLEEGMEVIVEDLGKKKTSTQGPTSSPFMRPLGR